MFAGLKERKEMLSHVRLFATLWTVAHQALLSMEFSRQEYWSRLPFTSPGDLPDSGIELMSLTSPALVSGIITPSTTWEARGRGTSDYCSLP